MKNKTKSPEKAINKTATTVDTEKKLIGISYDHRFSIKPFADYEGEPIQIDAKIEFANCTIEDAINDAIKTIIIRTQNRLRKMDVSDLEAMSGKQMVIDPTEKGRRGDMGLNRAVDLLMKRVGDNVIGGDKLQELIESLQKQVNKDNK